MAPQEPPSVITLKVKVPAGTIGGENDDIALGSLNTSVTVGAVRQQLQQLISTHPDPERQRLLYGGRVLSDDDQTLADALNTKRDPSQTDFVIHLIIRGEGFNGPIHHRPADNVNTSPQPAVAQQTDHPTQPQPPLQPQVRFAPNLPHTPNFDPRNVTLPHLPPGLQIPEQARIAFSHAIAQGQQHRAAMGMQGIGHPHTHPGISNVPGAPGNGADGQQNPHDTGRADGNTSTHPHDGPRSLSSQGFHLHGIGPDGQRFQVHHQTFNIPHAIHTGPQHIPQLGHLGPFPNIPLPNQLPHSQVLEGHVGSNGPGVPLMLDVARRNMATMRRMLDEMNAEDTTTDEQRARLRDIQERAAALNNYIDPFNVARPTTTAPFIPNRSPFQPTMQAQPTVNIPTPTFVAPSIVSSNSGTGNSDDITVYLVSSPLGPQALLFSPLHGSFRGGASDPAQQHRLAQISTPTGAERNAVVSAVASNDVRVEGQQAEPPAEAAQAMQQLQRLQDEARALAQPDPWAAAQPFIGHFWTLLRILVFAYFFLGSDLGWRRPLSLAAIGLGFWLMRLGPFADGGMVRRWWDGVMALPPPNGAAAPAAPGAPGPAAGNDEDRQAMPTPAQLAERLLAERNRVREARWQRVREWTRPIERALALFIASLWPGIGEAHVEATEREERRRQAEEIAAARQREEQERNRIEAETATESQKQGAGGEPKTNEASHLPDPENSATASNAESERIKGESTTANVN